MSQNVHPGPMWHCDNIFTPDVTVFSVYSLFTPDGGVLEIIEWSVRGRGWRGNDRHRPPLQTQWTQPVTQYHKKFRRWLKKCDSSYSFLPFDTIFLWSWCIFVHIYNSHVFSLVLLLVYFLAPFIFSFFLYTERVSPTPVTAPRESKNTRLKFLSQKSDRKLRSKSSEGGYTACK